MDLAIKLDLIMSNFYISQLINIKCYFLISLMAAFVDQDDGFNSITNAFNKTASFMHGSTNT